MQIITFDKGNYHRRMFFEIVLESLNGFEMRSEVVLDCVEIV